MTTSYLHADDYPLTIAVLSELFDGRDVRGFTAEPGGVEVDWNLLEKGVLSTTERATVTIAHGFAVIERSGGGYPGPESVGRVVARVAAELR